MKTINTSPISGMQELLPAEQAVFNSLKSKIAEVYAHHGFLDIETPAIERTEILLAKAGGDTEKQIYKVVKTAESADDADQALRFDHTVPLARYVIEHENALTFPFKVSQIGTNFRGERAQKGRFREFYQCDVDIIGRGTLPIAYDADVISTLLHALQTFGLRTPLLARINNRKILTGLLAAFNLSGKSQQIYNIIDHAEKVPLEKIAAAFTDLDLSPDDVAMLLDFINISGPREHVIAKLNALNITNETFLTGVSELDQVLTLLEAIDLAPSISADMKIVRGLDYYTGTVFEFILPEYKQIGSICGGGRYENLTKYFSEQPFPGVGGSIGLTRLFYVLNQYDLLETPIPTLIDYAIIPISAAETPHAFELAARLRSAGHSATLVLTDKKLGDKLSYASKLATHGIVIGESEVKTGAVKAKNFLTGTTADLVLQS